MNYKQTDYISLTESDLNDTDKTEELVFSPVTLADMDIIWPYLQCAPGRTTDFSFGGVAMWVDYFKYEFCIVRNTLFIKGVLENDREIPAFSLPVGHMSLPESIKMLREYCSSHNLQLRFSAVPELSLEEFAVFSDVTIEEIRNWEDYLYESEKLSTLSGKKMAKKRNHVNHFKNEYEGRWSYERLDVSNCNEALQFMDIVDMEGDMDEASKSERLLSRRILAEWPLLLPYMHGGILRLDGEICALTAGDIKGDTLFVHIEKADRRYDSTYEMINHLFAADMCASHPEIKYINREDDAGDEGLRSSKMSYHPVELLKKYNVEMRVR